MRTINIALLGIVVVTTACDPPSHPRQLANSIVNNLCDFSYDCCTPSERSQVGLASLGGDAPNKGECVEELYDQISGGFAEAVQAVDDGTAIYDAEAAEACTAKNRAALDSCDSQTILDDTLGSPFNRLFYLVDDTDTACTILAQRAFTRGTVADGDSCVSSFECKDFGTCLFLDENGDDLTGLARPATGACKVPQAEGGPCDEEDCGPGLECRFDAEQNASFCAAFELLADGEPCGFDDECATGTCVRVTGVCSSDQNVCTSPDDCGFHFCIAGACNNNDAACEDDSDCEATCDGAEPAVCGEATPPTIEVCDGL